MAFLLAGLSFLLAIIAKEKRYFKSGVNIAVAICVFAFIHFGLLEIRNGIEKSTKYFEFRSQDGKYSIVVTVRQGFWGNGNITLFQRKNRFFIQKKELIQTLDRWSSSFADQQYAIVWGMVK